MRRGCSSWCCFSVAKELEKKVAPSLENVDDDDSDGVIDTEGPLREGIYLIQATVWEAIDLSPNVPESTKMNSKRRQNGVFWI